MGIVKDIEEYIKSGETNAKGLGLEIEHFVLNDNGLPMTFDEITPLIKQVAEELNAKIIYMDGLTVGYITDEYSITLEPACQFEISINPYSELSDILRVYQKFLNTWEPLFKERGYRLETKGNLPLVELGLLDPNDIPLSPKKRYKYMDAYLKRSGNYGVHMMRASASAQISVDYSSEQDLIKKLRVLQKITPILMILTENKTNEDTILKGPHGKKHLFRIQEWDDLDGSRTGFYPNSFDKDFGYEQIANVVYNTPLILLTDKGETIGVGSKSAKDLFDEGTLTYDDLEETRKKDLIEHFFSMGFFHYRIKKYIEIRVADSLPIDKALGYVALLKNIVYSKKALDILDNELIDIDSAYKIQKAVETIENDGFDAVIYHGKTAEEWASYIIKLAEISATTEEKEYIEHVRNIRSDSQEEKLA